MGVPFDVHPDDSVQRVLPNDIVIFEGDERGAAASGCMGSGCMGSGLKQRCGDLFGSR